MEITYTMQNDLMIPDLTLPKQPEERIGKYGKMRLEFLKNHRRGSYGVMKANATLTQHLLEIDQTATGMVETLTKRFATIEGLTEQMKSENPMEWVQRMNQCKQSAEETVMRELIYN